MTVPGHEAKETENRSAGASAALICAWPALAAATILLLPFLKTPFTIDDPLYLNEARHILTDPLHPQAFYTVWSTDLRLRASQILPGGVAWPYVLLPAAWAGFSEAAGHLTQLVLLLVAIIATAWAALLLGLERWQARVAALLIVATPAVPGIAATVMPDIGAMTFSVLCMERLLALRIHRRWGSVVMAAVWLALAALTRIHTILLLAPAMILVLDGMRRDEIRASFRNFPARFLVVILAPALYFLASSFTADPEPGGENIVNALLDLPNSWHLLSQNAYAFLAHYTLVVPLAIPWLVLRFRSIPRRWWIAGTAGCAVLSLHLHWLALPIGATLFALADILTDAFRRRDNLQLALWLWLLPALPVIIYVQLPSKYLLPSVPAVALLIARTLSQAGTVVRRVTVAGTVAAGIALGFLILLGVRDLAAIQRKAVTQLIETRVATTPHVWIAGHWGFQWYAEQAGAQPVTLLAPFPQRGDIVVVSTIDAPVLPRPWSKGRIVEQEVYPESGPGRVMDFQEGAGFFSNRYGYLPWLPGAGKANRFEVWEVEEPQK